MADSKSRRQQTSAKGARPTSTSSAASGASSISSASMTSAISQGSPGTQRKTMQRREFATRINRDMKAIEMRNNMAVTIRAQTLSEDGPSDSDLMREKEGPKRPSPQELIKDGKHLPAHLRGKPTSYEDVVGSAVVSRAIAKDPYRQALLTLPTDDWQLFKTRRVFRTVDIPLPANNLNALPAQLRVCASPYLSDTCVIERKYASHTIGSSGQVPSSVTSNPPSFQIDVADDVGVVNSDTTQASPAQKSGSDSSSSSRRNSDSSVGADSDSKRVSTFSKQLVEANSASELMKDADEAPGWLLKRWDESTTVKAYAEERTHGRVPLLATVPESAKRPFRLDRLGEHVQPYKDTIENQQRFLVYCDSLELHTKLAAEPFMGTICLYDVKHKKQVSEMYHCNLTSDESMRTILLRNARADRELLQQLSGTGPRRGSHMVDAKLVDDLQKDTATRPAPNASTSLDDLLPAGEHPWARMDQKLLRAAAETPKMHDDDVMSRLVEHAAMRELLRDLRGRAPQAVFYHTYQALADVFVVVRVEKVLEGDPSKVFELYNNARVEETKEGKARSEAVNRFCRRLGDFRMPFAWAAVPLQDAVSLCVGDLRPAVELELFQQSPEKQADDELYKNLVDLVKAPSERTVTRRLKRIPGVLKLKTQQLQPNEHCPHTLTPNLYKVNPWSPDVSLLTVEMREFVPMPVFTPHRTYRHDIYVYPKFVNFEKHRNIACKIEFYDREANESGTVPPIARIYDRGPLPLPAEHRTKTVFAAVSYHNKTPSFYEEIKIRLPETLTDSHHVLFTFYHVKCKDRPKKEKTATDVIGYAWNQLMVKNRIRPTGEMELPVCTELPTGYLSEGGGKSSKWVDNKKALFKFNIVLDSSVISSDLYVHSFLMNTEEYLSLKPSDNNKSGNINLAMGIGILTQAKALAVVQFLPVILNQLLFIIQYYSREHALVRESFVGLCHVINTAQSNMEQPQMRHPDLAVFVKHMFNGLGFTTANTASAHGPRLHEEILHWLGVYTLYNEREGKPAKVSHEVVMTHTWFFFELIIKSVALQACAGDKGSNVGSAREMHVFLTKLREVVLQMVALIVTNQVPSGAPRLVSAIAFCLRDMLSYVHRGAVFGMIHDVFCLLYHQEEDKRSPQYVDADTLACYRLDMLEIICSHEHFVTLNVPLSGVGVHQSGIHLKDYVRDHFLIGLLLAEVEQMLYSPAATTRMEAIRVLRRLLAMHEADTRYNENPTKLARVFQLYFPIIPMLLDYDPLFRVVQDVKQRNEASFETIRSGRRGAMAPPVSGDGGRTSTTPGIVLEDDESAELLTLFMYIVSSIKLSVFREWWKDKVPKFLCRLMDIMAVCVYSAAYHGRKDIKVSLIAHADTETVRKYKLLQDSFQSKYQGGGTGATSRYSRLRSDSMSAPSASSQRALSALSTASGASASSASSFRSAKQPTTAHRPKTAIGFGSAGGRSTSAGKITLARYASQEDVRRVPTSTQQAKEKKVDETCAMAAHRSNEAGVIALNIIDAFMTDFQVKLRDMSRTNELMAHMVGVLVALQHTHQSNVVVANLFRVLHNFVNYFPAVVFQGRCEICSTLCELTLKYCASHVKQNRAIAATFLYVLMRANYKDKRSALFARVKVQATIALSRVVEMPRIDEYVKKALATIISISSKDRKREVEFRKGVTDLAMNLYTILKNTSQVRQFREHEKADTEMSVELHYRIAESYKDSPRLRVEWLQHLENIHASCEQFAEAGFCAVHAAAIVAEYLTMLEERPDLPRGAKAFTTLSPNVLEESLSRNEHKRTEDEDGDDNVFEVSTMENLLITALQHFQEAKMFEYMVEVYKLLIPIYEAARRYDELAATYGVCENIAASQALSSYSISECYVAIIEQDKVEKRFFGTYFRVGFFCNGPYVPVDIRNKTFVSRERSLISLAELSLKLKTQYTQYCGDEIDEIITVADSKQFTAQDIKELPPRKLFLQLTFVEPCDTHLDENKRETPFEKHTRVRMFVFETPFTESGKARGDIASQRLRRTTLKVEKFFPYIKKRLEVVKTTHVELTPIEVAIDSVQKKCNELSLLVNRVNVDMKLLQLKLQGSVSVSVNEGPGEIASIFLDKRKDIEDKTKVKLLRRKFNLFLAICEEALVLNESKIEQDQLDYHRSLAAGFAKMQSFIRPLCLTKSASASTGTASTPGNTSVSGLSGGDDTDV
eukprot:m.1632108 g.1632108  ORF g.1632108 m.1632108 type:complete len:2191 (-) comp25404_c0_seq3:4177-10749(-)